MTWLRALRSSFPFAQLTERYAFARFARNAERNRAVRVDSRAIRDDSGAYLSLFVDAIK